MGDRHLVVVTRVAEGGNRFDGETDHELPAVPSERWVAGRAVLLERVTAAALRRVRSPLTWVWRTHPDRAGQVRTIAGRVWPGAVVIEDGTLTRDDVAPDATAFLVVRLDADDAIHPQQLDRVARTRLAPGTIVNWHRGYKLNWLTGQVRPCEWPLRHQGPFMAYTQESRAAMFHVRGDHGNARTDAYPNLLNIGARSWLWTWHGSNMMNKWPGRRWATTPDVPEAQAQEVLASMGVKR